MTDKLAYKTFSSQFALQNKSQISDALYRLLPAIRSNKCQLIHALAHNPQQIHTKDNHNKNLLFYAIHQKCQNSLLYLLMLGLTYTESDSENKNIYHFITYSGSIQCLQILNFYIKLTKNIKINNILLKLLAKFNYKRTDMKQGKLKYSVSVKRQQLFQQLQKQAQKIYVQYLKQYIEELQNNLSQVDQLTQRNPIHLLCLNKYQKCLATLQQIIYQLFNPKLEINNKILQNISKVNQCLAIQTQIDPRFYEDTLKYITNILPVYNVDKINKNYQKNVRKILAKIFQIKDKDGHSSLYIASKNGSTAMINLLQKYIPKTQNQQKQQIMKAANHNLARSLIIDLCDASKLADVKPMNFLLSCGEQINKKKSIFGTFPLIQALKSYIETDSVQPLKVLLKNGADINAQDTNGWTVLHHAANLGLKDIVQMMLKQAKQYRLQINKVTNKRYHALHLAAMNQNPQIITLLISNTVANVNINVADWDGCTALIHAAKKGSIKVLKVLLNLQADIYAKDVRDMTALHHSAFSNHPQCIRLLLNYDSDFDKLRSMRNTKGKLAKDLCTDTKPFQNIFTAARVGNVNLIRKLIQQNPSVRDSTTLIKQRTPLMQAVLAKSLISIKFLIDTGADTYHQDKQGKSVANYCQGMLQQAKKLKKLEDIKILQQINKLING